MDILFGFTQAQLQSNATETSEAELALHTEVRGLRSELDEAKRKNSRLSQEHCELSLRVEDSERDKDTLKQTIGKLEETKRQQEKALEKLNKEVRRMDPLYQSLFSLLNGDRTAQKKLHLFIFSPPLFLCQYDSLNVSLKEETQALKVQLEEQRERARKEMHEAQRHGNDAHSELERSQLNLRKLEEEVCARI